MRALLAIVAGLFGGVAGYAVTAVVAFLLLGPAGAGDSGELAMGVMFSIAPIGAVVGAFAGVFLALSAGRRRGQIAGDTGSAGGADDAGALVSSSPNRGMAQGLIAVGVIAGLIAGIYYTLFHEYSPPSFSRFERKPSLMFEVSVPEKAVAEDRFFKARGELRSWHHTFAPKGGLQRRVDNNNVVFSGSMQMYNKIDDRKFWLWPSQYIFVEFELPTAAVPAAEAEFGAWRDADRIVIQKNDGTIYQLETAEAKIRTRVVWP